MQEFTGLDYVKIAGANAMGLGNETFNHRIAMFEQHVSMDDDGVYCDWDNVDEPITLHKALRAYEDTMNDIPTGYIMGLDSTASGLQVMAVLSGCMQTAIACNLTYTGERENAYELVANGMNSMLLDYEFVTPKDVKNPVMTHFYNSIAGPRKRLSVEQLKAFYIILAKEFPGATDVMESINGCWTNKDMFIWHMQDGFTVVNRNFIKHTADIKIFDHTFNYSWTEFGANGNHLPLPANITHSVDGYIAREVVRLCPFEVLIIHDCFYCSPNNMEMLRTIYRQILAKIATSTLLQDILIEITGNKELIYNKVGDGELLAKAILESEYAIC